MKSSLPVTLLGIAFSAFLLWFVFRSTDWPAVWQAIVTVDWWWLIVGVAVVIASMFTRVLRWRYIVSADQPVAFSTLFDATQIGIMGNYVLPGRVGELIRAAALSRMARMPITKSVAFVALDRLTDLFALLVVLIISVLTFTPKGDIVLPPEIYATPIPGSIIISLAWGTAALSLVLLIILVLIFLNQQLFRKISNAILSLLSNRIARKVSAMIRNFSHGLHIFRRRGDLFWSLAYSLVTWALMVYSNVFVFMAFGIDGPWNLFFVLTAFLAVAVSVPGAPGFVGQFHFAVTVTIVAMLPDTDLNIAKAMAIVAHLLVFIPVVLVGIYSLINSRSALLYRTATKEETSSSAM